MSDWPAATVMPLTTGLPGGRRRWSSGRNERRAILYEELRFGHAVAAWMRSGVTGQEGAVAFSGKISLVYWRMPRGGHPEDDYMSLPVVCNARVWPRPSCDLSSDDRCGGKEGCVC